MKGRGGALGDVRPLVDPRATFPFASVAYVKAGFTPFRKAAHPTYRPKGASGKGGHLELLSPQPNLKFGGPPQGAIKVVTSGVTASSGRSWVNPFRGLRRSSCWHLQESAGRTKGVGSGGTRNARRSGQPKAVMGKARGGRGGHLVIQRGAKHVWRVPLDSKGATIHSDQEEGNRVAGNPSSPSSIGEADTSIADPSGWPVPTTKEPRRPKGDSPTVGEATSSRGAKESIKNSTSGSANVLQN